MHTRHRVSIKHGRFRLGHFGFGSLFCLAHFYVSISDVNKTKFLRPRPRPK